VILNLVSNALKFTFSGSITIKVSYEERSWQQELSLLLLEEFHESANASLDDSSNSLIARDSYLHVSVIDTGLGISEENQSKLF